MAGRGRFLAALRAGTILLDGPMGTRAMAELRISRPPAEGCSRWNLTNPEMVRAIHGYYIAAGSIGLLTNTFDASLTSLERVGFEREWEERNRLGVVLAREAAGPDRFVLGSIGPIAGPAAATCYRSQAAILCEAGCDAIVLETQESDQAMLGVTNLVGEVPIPILISLWTWPEDAAIVARRLEDGGAAAIGTNCGRGLDHVLRATEAIADAVSVPLLVKPSAGADGRGETQGITPERFSDAITSLIPRGVRLVGGCCGADESHIRALARHRQLQAQERDVL